MSIFDDDPNVRDLNPGGKYEDRLRLSNRISFKPQTLKAFKYAALKPTEMYPTSMERS